MAKFIMSTCPVSGDVKFDHLAKFHLMMFSNYLNTLIFKIHSHNVLASVDLTKSMEVFSTL